MEIAGIFVLIFFIASWVICVLKGKWWFALLAIFVPVFFVAAVVGSFRLAKPTSFWARRFYDREQLEQSVQRFLTEEEYAEFRERTGPPKDEVGELAPRIE